jgi:hypothetical protein
VIEIPKVGGLHHLYTRKAAYSKRVSKRSRENAERAVRHAKSSFLWNSARGLTLDATGMEYGSHR